MTTHKVALHGTPGDPPGSQRMKEVTPYDGEHPLVIEHSMVEFTGLKTELVNVKFSFAYVDEHDVPHYQKIG